MDKNNRNIGFFNKIIGFSRLKNNDLTLQPSEKMSFPVANQANLTEPKVSKIYVDIY